MHVRRAGLAALRAPVCARAAGTGHSPARQQQQRRGLSELYDKIVKKRLPAASSADPVEPPAKTRSGIVSSIPLPRIRTSAAATPKFPRRDAPAEPIADPKSVAEEYTTQLHASSWSGEETWTRFGCLPRESLAHLRDIDVNFTLARIRGSARSTAREQRTRPTTVTLKRMLEVFEAARRAGVVPDRYTFQELVAVNVWLLNFGHAREWIERMEQQGLTPTIRPYRTLLNGYSSAAGEINSARELWQEIKRKIAAGQVAPETPGGPAPTLDLLTYTCIIGAEARAGNFAAVVDLLDEMDASGIRADLALRNMILDGILRHQGLDAGLAEARLMEESGFAPDTHSYMYLLGAACKEQRSDDIRSLLRAAAGKGVIPSAYTIQALPFGPFEVLDTMASLPAANKLRLYNVLVEAAMRRNHFGLVLQLTDHMRSNGVAPNVVTYTVLLDALNKAGRLDQAKTLFERLLHSTELQLDTHIFSIMVDASGRHGDVREMFLYMSEMRKRSVPVTEPIYNSVLAALSRWRRDNLQAVMLVARELECARPQVSPTARTFSAIFAAFVAQAQRRRLGAGELEFLQTWYGYAGSKYYVAKDGYFYFMAVNAFVSAGSLADAAAAFGDMARHAEQDPAVAGRFAEKPSCLASLMTMAVEQQEFDIALNVWAHWRPLRLPPLPDAAKLALFACDQTGRIQAAQSMVQGLLARPATGSPGAAESCPAMVSEAVLAVYIAMLIKHGQLAAVVPAMEQWADATQPAPTLSERTVSRLARLLHKSKHSAADQVRDELLAFVERRFPDAVPV